MELKELIDKFEQRQQSRQHPLLLVDLSGGNENTHTNILMSLLRFNGYQFFPSFLRDVLHVSDWKRDTKVTMTTQKKAVGVKKAKNTNGFIDLYIEYIDVDDNVQRIVIENKINGASDTKYQLLRYIASVKDNPIQNNIDFEGWRGSINMDVLKDECSNCHFIYLTLDGSKVPEEVSIPKVVLDNINYYPINYQVSILPWLKDTVLRLCPYYDDGITVAGLRQYIASLEGMMLQNMTVSEEVKKYVTNKIQCLTFKESFNSIQKDINQLPKNADSVESYNQLARELKKAVEEFFTQDIVPEGWVLHCSPSLMVLYKTEWTRISRGTYSIPFVNLGASPTVMDSLKSVKWYLNIEHFSPDAIRQVAGKGFSSLNHDRTAQFDLSKWVNSKGAPFASRKALFESVIEQCGPIIKIVDESVAQIKKDLSKYTRDSEIRIALLDVLLEKLKNNNEKPL